MVATTIIALSILLSAQVNTAADKDEDEAEVIAEYQRRQSYRVRRPRRLEGPLREENISDIEVREIERVMTEHFPGSIVNIASVVDGCSCADGALCDSQVWVVAHQLNRNNGIMLSRIDDNWRVGPLQLWWLRYDRIRRRINEALATNDADKFEIVRGLQEQENLLRREFPACVEEQ